MFEISKKYLYLKSKKVSIYLSIYLSILNLVYVFEILLESRYIRPTNLSTLEFVGIQLQLS